MHQQKYFTCDCAIRKKTTLKRIEHQTELSFLIHLYSFYFFTRGLPCQMLQVISQTEAVLEEAGFYFCTWHEQNVNLRGSSLTHEEQTT